jgi:hypothetical protein
MKLRLIAFPLILLGLVFLSSPAANAQRGGGFGHAPAGPGRIGHGPRLRPASPHFHHSRVFYNGYSPYYFYPDYGFSDYDDDTGMVEAPPPPQFIGPPPGQASPRASAPSAPESVMLELRGDHWVRITNYGQSESGGPSSQELASNPSAAGPTRRIQTVEAPSPLPPAVLVFRDGHQEEIGKYVIVGKTIRVSEDYWTQGSWSKTVQIANLDIPATLKLNQERGTKFSLPSGPNEVVFRP